MSQSTSIWMRLWNGIPHTNRPARRIYGSNADRLLCGTFFRPLSIPSFLPICRSDSFDFRFIEPPPVYRASRRHHRIALLRRCRSISSRTRHTPATNDHSNASARHRPRRLSVGMESLLWLVGNTIRSNAAERLWLVRLLQSVLIFPNRILRAIHWNRHAF